MRTPPLRTARSLKFDENTPRYSFHPLQKKAAVDHKGIAQPVLGDEQSLAAVRKIDSPVIHSGTMCVSGAVEDIEVTVSSIDSMERGNDPIVHEIGQAKQVVFSSARPMVVRVKGDSTPEINRQQSVEEDVGCGERHPDEVQIAATPSEAARTSSIKTNPRGPEKEYLAIRTADWVESVYEEAGTPPGHAPPLALIENKHSTEPTNMVNSHRERHQAPNDSAIRGNFVPLSTSFRARSPSPQRDQGPHGVYLQFSLTDSQMDKLTAVLSSENGDESLVRGRARHADQDAEAPKKTNKENTAPSMRSRSPDKMPQLNKTPSRARSRSPVKFNVGKTPERQRTVQGFKGNDTSASPSKAQEAEFAWGTSNAHGAQTHPAGRVTKGPPPPIDTDIARVHAKVAAYREGKQPVVVVHNPPEKTASPVRRSDRYATTDDSSSYYSQDSTRERYPSCISPLRIHKATEPKQASILQEYAEIQNAPRGSDKASVELEQRGTTDEASSGAELAYTPLAPFLPKGAPTIRKASKTLIGEGGWLENTSKPAEPTASPTRAGGFLGNLVKKAKGMIEANQDSRAQRKSRESDKSRPTSRQLAISLSPREQSLLYCELEFVVATALNDYITAQFNAGRLETDRLKKVAEDWQRKGRPKVVGFRYDLETQLDLVRVHVNDFKFYSRIAATTAILGIIDTMKANARVLRIRTFCQPDTVIAKQLLDSQSLFNILGCPEDQQIKLAEIIAFFKAAIERERMQARQDKPETAAPSASAPVAAATLGSPMRNTRSPTRQGGEDWWGTAAAANGGQLRRSKSHGAGPMDPAGYESQGE
ncbi:hypothetical protein VTI74DRAFT_3896 [Chaetomium olivicolor]